MKRRTFLFGVAGAGVAAWLGKPRDEGKPYDEYFRSLNALLRKQGPARPCLVLDADRLDHNVDVVTESIRAPKHYRVVAKSLPSVKLLDYVSRRAKTDRLMAFHQPFLNIEAEAFPTSDILLGKPMPARSAAIFYAELKGSFDPARQLQWLIDTPERLVQYLELAKAQRLRLRVNIEIDVGLRRGGVADELTLAAMLDTIAAHAQSLELAGFMGYDPHVVKLPRLVGSREQLFEKVLSRYQGFVDVLRKRFPALWRENLTLNAAGSPTYRLYEKDTLANDLSVGSALVKPTDFDLDTLSDHVPALFIATPVLKVSEGTRLPGLEAASGLIAAVDRNRRRTYFMYGGHWMAKLEAPRGLRPNRVYGYSSNQELVNGSAATALAVDDHVFLRPTQSEALMLQFGDIVVVRGGEIVDSWPVLASRI